MGLCAGDVDEGDEEGGDGDFCATDDVGDELGEFGVLCVARQGATAGRGRGPAEGVVDSVHDVIHNIFWREVSDGWRRVMEWRSPRRLRDMSTLTSWRVAG